MAFSLAMPQSMLYLTQVPGSPVSETRSKPGSPRRTTAEPVLMATEVVASIHQLAELRVAEGATAQDARPPPLRAIGDAKGVDAAGGG